MLIGSENWQNSYGYATLRRLQVAQPVYTDDLR
jgi:hypothetical protein